MGCSFPLVDSAAQPNRCSQRTALGVGRAWRRGAGKVAGDWQGGGVQDLAPSRGWTVTLQTTYQVRQDLKPPPHMQRSVWRSELFRPDRRTIGIPASAIVKHGSKSETDYELGSRRPSVLFDLRREPGLPCAGSDKLVSVVSSVNMIA